MRVFLSFVQRMLLLSPAIALALCSSALAEAAPTAEPGAEVVTVEALESQPPAAIVPESPERANPAEALAAETAAPIAAPAPTRLMGQVTSVSQLSDVQPTDWAFQAVQSLVERYGCIAGYPDGTYRGDRALTRYEFAAGLNACLDRVNELIAEGLSDAVTREDLATLERLQAEFAAELATLRGRTDSLEARTAELEANQFSTTTVLNGETLFGVVSALAGDDADGNDLDRIPTFGYRVEMNLNTSFDGEDLLTARIQANNINTYGGVDEGVLGTNMGRIEFGGSSSNNARISLLRYRFPISDRTTAYIAATGNGFVDLDASAQLTPYTDGSAVSLFGLRNPIYNYSSGTGLGIRHFFNDDIELNLGYLASDANDPTDRGGLFNGKYGALAQLIFYPSDNIRLGLSYIHSYTPSEPSAGTVSPNILVITYGTATGSNLSNTAFGRAVVTNAYGISGTIDLTPGLALGGWVGLAQQRYIGRGDATVWNWAVNLAFPDLGGEGNIGGIIVGMEPRVTEISSTINNGEPDQDVGLHLEAYYRYNLTDNIDITPGVIWITAPDHNADNDDAVVGVLRTRFRF